MLEDLSEVKEGTHVLRSKPLKTAAKQLMDLLQKVPERIAMEPGDTLDTEMRALLKDARKVRNDADRAFKKVRTPSEKIRAVVVACAALVATAAAGGDAESIRADLAAEMKKLFALKEVKHDIAEQMGETRDYATYLSLKRARVDRLNAAVGALVHAEAFAAARRDDVPELEVILNRGVMPRVTDVEGNTLLHAACSRGALRAAKLVVRWAVYSAHPPDRAFLSLRSANGRTALDVCRDGGHERMEARSGYTGPHTTAFAW